MCSISSTRQPNSRDYLSLPGTLLLSTYARSPVLGQMDTLSVHAMPQPSLLGLDAGSLNHLFHCLPLKELLALSQSCKSLYNLITYEGLIWKYQLYRQFGVDLRSVASSTAQQQPLPRDFCRLLIETSKQLRPVRFTAVYTDGGVDTGAPYYWCGTLPRVLRGACSCAATAGPAELSYHWRLPCKSQLSRLRFRPLGAPHNTVSRPWVCPSTTSPAAFPWAPPEPQQNPRPSPPIPCRCCCQC